MYRESYFDGGLFSYWPCFISNLHYSIDFWDCAPWGECIMYNWKVKHTVIDGIVVSTLTARLCSYLEIGSNGGSYHHYIWDLCSG